MMRRGNETENNRGWNLNKRTNTDIGEPRLIYFKNTLKKEKKT